MNKQRNFIPTQDQLGSLRSMLPEIHELGEILKIAFSDGLQLKDIGTVKKGLEQLRGYRQAGLNWNVFKSREGREIVREYLSSLHAAQGTDNTKPGQSGEILDKIERRTGRVLGLVRFYLSLPIMPNFKDDN